MLQFGLRLGDGPQALVTTTPRPIPLLKEIIADKLEFTGDSTQRRVTDVVVIGPGNAALAWMVKAGV